MKSETHLAASIAIVAWLHVMLADWFGLLGSAKLGKSLLVTFYAASCIGLHFVRRGGEPVPRIIPWGGALVLAWCLFVLYGTLLDSIRLQDLVEPPSRTGLALLFVNGPLTALLVSAVLAYPLAVIYGRSAGIMAVVVAMPVFAYSASGLIEADFSRLSSTIMALETVCLYVALRTAPRMVLRLLRGGGAALSGGI